MLNNPSYFTIDNVPSSISELSFYCVPAQMVLVIVGGFTYDILGRKLTIGLSFVLTGVFALLMPYTGPDIYPWLLVTKLLATMVIQPLFSSPLLNDIVMKETRPRGLALIHLGINVGLFLAHLTL